MRNFDFLFYQCSHTERRKLQDRESHYCCVSWGGAKFYEVAGVGFGRELVGGGGGIPQPMSLNECMNEL